MEAVVSIILLVIVLVVAMSLLFAMKSFAERQQFSTAPRQTARKAIDYLSYYVAGATDLNVRNASGTLPSNPNALLMYWGSSDTNPNARQATFNNFTGLETGPGGWANSVVNNPDGTQTTLLGDIGTDAITLAVPTKPLNIPVSQWPGNNHGANMYFDFSAGCPNDRLNMDLFKEATGFDPASGLSAPLTLVDQFGNWVYFQITDYHDNGTSSPPGSTCAASGSYPTRQIIHANLSPGTSLDIDPPSGSPQLDQGPPPITLSAGWSFVSFRVRNRRLEQKAGRFDPTTDNPYPDPSTGLPAFTPVIENIEDFQIAYIYRDGQVWNSGQTGFSLKADGPKNPDGIPPQLGPCAFYTGSCLKPQWCTCVSGLTAPDPRDIIYVTGLRISITARSNRLSLASSKLTFSPAAAPGTAAWTMHLRPQSEDNLAQTTPIYDADGVTIQVYDYNRMTATIGIRNRMLQSPM